MTAMFDRELVRASAETLRAKRDELACAPGPDGRGWAPLQRRMTDALSGPTDRIGDVIAKQTALQVIMDDLPPSPAANRVAAFNSLYLTITKRVDGALSTTSTQPEFLERLDVEFAKRYFNALTQWGSEDPAATPDVWEILFKRCSDVEVSKLVAAMLGVNAHINHDLALALVSTWEVLGPPQDGVVHPDYLLVNKIFYEEIPPLRRQFSTSWQLDLDHAVGPLDDWTQSMLVYVTRAHAWEQGLKLWQLRDDAADFEQARRAMDRIASFLGEFAIVGDRVNNDTGDVVTGGWHLLRHFGRDVSQEAALEVTVVTADAGLTADAVAGRGEAAPR